MYNILYIYIYIYTYKLEPMPDQSDLEGVSGLRCTLVWPADLARREFWAFSAPWFGLGDWVGMGGERGPMGAFR